MKCLMVSCDLRLEENVFPQQSWNRQHPDQAFDGGAFAYLEELGPQGGLADCLQGWNVPDAAPLVQPVQKVLLQGGEWERQVVKGDGSTSIPQEVQHGLLLVFNTQI